jgi:hypothetical protein
MKKIRFFVIAFILLFSGSKSLSQSCIPDYIWFHLQSEVDSFAINYPGCTMIEGDVKISGDVANLNGLNVLNAIGGDLEIYNTLYLTNCTGLDNLSSVGGDLSIQSNYVLSSLAGLQDLTSVGGELDVSYNNTLVSIEALNNIDGSSLDKLSVYHNNNLTNCSAECLCEYLTNPPGIVNIYYNGDGCDNPPQVADQCGFTLSCLPFGNYYFLSQADINSFQENYPGCQSLTGKISINGEDITNVTGLSEITKIDGHTYIEGNEQLSDLTGLNNVSKIDGIISISYNPQLSVLNGFNSTDTIDGNFFIYQNENLADIPGMSSLLYVAGDLQIMDNVNLSGLSGFNHLEKIGGYLGVILNPSLLSLSGFESLDTLEGLDIWQNNSLPTLEGFESLTYINQNLGIAGNEGLISLSGLETLVSVGIGINIYENNALLTLSGIDNIEPGILNSLSVRDNPLLSECDVNSVCEYLATPGASVNIANNATGCSTREEVESACGVGLSDHDFIKSHLSIYPNPASDVLFIEFSERMQSISIYDSQGDKVIRWYGDKGKVELHVDGLAPGIYLVRVNAGKKNVSKKIIIMR